MNDTLAGASPVDQPVGRPCPKRYESGRIKGLEVTPLYDRAAIDAAVAAERVQIAARIREAWHQREASHGNRAGEYHEGMLAGLDAAVALALGPNAELTGAPLR